MVLHREIAFRKGDIIIFYRIIDANWCEGEAQGKIGLFPSSYVEVKLSLSYSNSALHGNATR